MLGGPGKPPGTTGGPGGMAPGRGCSRGSRAVQIKMKKACVFADDLCKMEGDTQSGSTILGRDEVRVLLNGLGAIHTNIKLDFPQYIAGASTSKTSNVG